MILACVGVIGVLAGYRFEHPRTEVSVEVRSLSYLWAGLFGALYVWRKGCGQQFWKAFAFNILYAVVFIGAWGATSIPQVPVRMQALFLLALVPTLILIQANTMIRIIKDAYRRRGWMIRLA
jgi:hypothetical protein